MIVVTRLNGGQFGVNPDLIQRIDSAPDTILTLIDGTKFIVAEPMADVIARVHEYRATVLARARVLADEVEDSAGTPDGADDGPIAPAVPLRPRSHRLRREHGGLARAAEPVEDADEHADRAPHRPEPARLVPLTEPVEGTDEWEGEH